MFIDKLMTLTDMAVFRLLSALGGCDRLKSAMIVGTPALGAQYLSDKVSCLSSVGYYQIRII